MQKTSAFTTSYTAISNVLGGKAKISAASSIIPGSDKPILSVNVIWDTGATNSVISPQIAKNLGLIPIGMTTVHTAGSIERCNIYKIDLLLPNQVTVMDVRVTGMNIYSAEALIGMDIIALGDFAVTNTKGKTCFTFRTPSRRVIDFVKEAEKENKHGGITDKHKRKQEKANKKKGRK